MINYGKLDERSHASYSLIGAFFTKTKWASELMMDPCSNYKWPSGFNENVGSFVKYVQPLVTTTSHAMGTIQIPSNPIKSTLINHETFIQNKLKIPLLSL